MSDKPRMIGTIGHIDHAKTSLTAARTGRGGDVLVQSVEPLQRFPAGRGRVRGES